VPISSLHILSRAPLEGSGRWRAYEIGSSQAAYKGFQM
jgi:hypothetical protein